MKLYTYFRSSAAYRVRIALNLKGIAYESMAVNLLKGEQRSDAYGAVNPQRRLPALDIGGTVLIQSPAILEYLDEVHPEPPLLPVGAIAEGQGEGRKQSDRMRYPSAEQSGRPQLPEEQARP